MAYVSVALVRRAFRRSRLRVGSVLVLDEMGPLPLLDLALALGADARNVLGALVGRDPAYRARDSLVSLGLVRERAVRGFVVFELTAAGRRVAARLRRENARFSRVLPIARRHST